MVALPSLGEDERVIDAEDARIRLLICNTCESIDPLPSFDGPLEYDDVLNYRLAQHRYADGNPHIGGMATVSEKSWEDPGKRKKILEELWKARTGREVGLGTKMYDTRSTFQEDAMACWRSKNRTENCDEYRTERKKLLPDTRGDRKELGLSTKASARPGTYLCTFCPYHSIVMQRARKAQGWY